LRDRLSLSRPSRVQGKSHLRNHVMADRGDEPSSGLAMSEVGVAYVRLVTEASAEPTKAYPGASPTRLRSWLTE